MAALLIIRRAVFLIFHTVRYVEKVKVIFVKLMINKKPMKRKLVKLRKVREEIKVELDLHFYEDGQIILEDYKAKTYYVFDELPDALNFLRLNYE